MSSSPSNIPSPTTVSQKLFDALILVVKDANAVSKRCTELLQQPQREVARAAFLRFDSTGRGLLHRNWPQLTAFRAVVGAVKTLDIAADLLQLTSREEGNRNGQNCFDCAYRLNSPEHSKTLLNLLFSISDRKSSSSLVVTFPTSVLYAIIHARDVDALQEFFAVSENNIVNMVKFSTCLTEAFFMHGPKLDSIFFSRLLSFRDKFPGHHRVLENHLLYSAFRNKIGGECISLLLHHLSQEKTCLKDQLLFHDHVSGQTCLHQCACSSSDSLATMNLVLIACCKLEQEDNLLHVVDELLLSRDSNGNTPLHLVAASNDFDKCSLFVSFIPHHDFTSKRIFSAENKEHLIVVESTQNDRMRNLLEDRDCLTICRQWYKQKFKTEPPVVAIPSFVPNPKTPHHHHDDTTTAPKTISATSITIDDKKNDSTLLKNNELTTTSPLVPKNNNKKKTDHRAELEQLLLNHQLSPKDNDFLHRAVDVLIDNGVVSVSSFLKLTPEDFRNELKEIQLGPRKELLAVIDKESAMRVHNHQQHGEHQQNSAGAGGDGSTSEMMMSPLDSVSNHQHQHQQFHHQQPARKSKSDTAVTHTTHEAY